MDPADKEAAMRRRNTREVRRCNGGSTAQKESTMRKIQKAGAVLVVAGAFMTGGIELGAAAAAPAAPAEHFPNRQVVDGLYKSVGYRTQNKDGSYTTWVCILTTRPWQTKLFTQPPVYSCVKAP
jgi:hypothetical protein